MRLEGTESLHSPRSWEERRASSKTGGEVSSVCCGRMGGVARQAARRLAPGNFLLVVDGVRRRSSFFRISSDIRDVLSYDIQ